MSSQKFLVIAILACTALVVVAKPNGMPLQYVEDKTICRTKVEYDENPDRIPKTIKMIRCADEPYEMCPAGSGKEVPCCGAFSLSSGTQLSCTEVMDDVLVFDTAEKKEYRMNVPIACNCIKENANTAAE